MPELFISYSKRDAASVGEIAHCLRKRGLEVWFDQTNILASQNVVLEIDLALAKCSHFLLFASKAYFDSEWATAEYRAALYAALSAKTTSVVVIKLDDISLPPLLGPLNHILFTTPNEVCDKIASLVPATLDKSSPSRLQSSSTSKCSWDSLEDALRYLLIDALFANLGSLRQQVSSETTFRVEVNERL